MRTIYSLSINLYSFIIRVASIFNPKARLWIKGQKNIFEKIKKDIDPGYIVWIHAASVGEFEQAKPLINKIKKENPHKKILVTFFSPSAYENLKNYELADYIFYLPIDTKRNAQKFIELIRPEIVFFVKYEFWFNYINELYSKQIPLYLISGIFRPNQHFFKFYGKWFTKHLKMFKHFFLQTKSSAKLLGSLGIRNFSVTGDTRFDTVYSNSQKHKTFEKVNQFAKNNNVLLCGSTWPQDEKIIYNYLKNGDKNLKIIIAPHEIDKTHISNLLDLFKNYNPVLWTSLQNDDIIESKILIIDSIGQLKHLYQYATIAYIGGGFGIGIHNILEAACFGKPIIIGPNYKKFNEAIELIKLSGVFSIKNTTEFSEHLTNLLNDNCLISQSGYICKKYVEDSIGATDSIYKSCFEEPSIL